MPDFVTARGRAVKRQNVVALALVLPLMVSAAPARAQDILGLFKLIFSPPAVPVPAYQPFDYPAVRAPGQPVARPRVKPVRVEPPAIKMPLTPKAPGEIANPVPELLADSTLRAGDMVMFPDGLRVFTGRTGSQHAMTDFEPVSQAGRAVPRATRKLAASLRPGRNDAWSSESARSGGKLGAETRKVETLGSLSR